MKTLRLDTPDLELSFDAAMKAATALAESLLDGAMLLSWYDRDRHLEAPGHVSECHEGCPTPGYLDYAANRGGALTVDFQGGRFVFCFRALEE